MPVVNTIESLTTAMQKRVREFLAELTKKKIPIRVAETYRTQAVQDAYYAQGRETLAKVNVRRAAAGLSPLQNDAANVIITQTLSSLHTKRIAIDLYPLTNGIIDYDTTSEKAIARWLTIGSIGEKYGLNWGGRWKINPSDRLGWDCGHFEYNSSWKPSTSSIVGIINYIIGLFFNSH